MTQYKEYFHHTELGSATGIIFMIYTIGNMVAIANLQVTPGDWI